jgi:hypothetical protein
MPRKFLLTLVITAGSILNVTNLYAQIAFENWAVGIETGTYGPGITVATSLSPNVKLKAGLDYFGYTNKTDFYIEPDGFLQNNPSVNNIPLKGSLFDPQLKFINFKAIVDYYPMANGIFSVSAGFYAGSSAISLSGKFDDYQKLTQQHGGAILFDIEDITIKPESDGSFDGKIKFGNAIKPYFGIGLGRTIANSRVGFKFDLGVIYQGNYKFESDQVVNASILSSKMSSLTDDTDIPAGLLKIWPVINFSLSYRIF